jgi:hypothetical protein
MNLMARVTSYLIGCALLICAGIASAYSYGLAEWVDVKRKGLEWPTRVVDYETGEPLEGVLVVRSMSSFFKMKNDGSCGMIHAEFSDQAGRFDLSRTHSFPLRFLFWRRLTDTDARAYVSPYKLGYMLNGVDENPTTKVTTLRMQKIRTNSQYQLETMRHILTLPNAKGTPNEGLTAHFMAYHDTDDTLCGKTGLIGEFMKKQWESIPRVGPTKSKDGAELSCISSLRSTCTAKPTTEISNEQLKKQEALAACTGARHLVLSNGDVVRESRPIPDRCNHLK